MGHPLRNFWHKKITGSGQVTELRRHKRYSLRATFQGNRIFSHGTCCPWLEWGHYAWFRWAYDHMWTLTLHNDLAKVIWGHWSWLTPYIPKLANLAFLEVSWGLETEYVANFYIDMFIVPLYTNRWQSGPLTQFALGRFCRWGWCCSLPGCYASNIPSINCNDTSSISKLNGKHAVGSFRSLRFIVYEIY